MGVLFFFCSFLDWGLYLRDDMALGRRKGSTYCLEVASVTTPLVNQGTRDDESCSEDDEYGRMNERDSLSSSFSWVFDETVSLLAESTHFLEYTLSLARTDFQWIKAADTTAYDSLIQWNTMMYVIDFVSISVVWHVLWSLNLLIQPLTILCSSETPRSILGASLVSRWPT